MAKQKARLFLGNLPAETSESGIKRKLEGYGEVASIEIKQKKEIDNETIVSTFAYVDLNAERSTLQQCLQDLKNKDWNGCWIKAELAKESFLQRLQRERNENSSRASSENRKTSLSNDYINIPEKVKALALPSKDISFKRRTSFEDNNSSGEENLVSKLESFSDLWKDAVPVRLTKSPKHTKIERNQHFVIKDVPCAKSQSLHSSLQPTLAEKESNPSAKAGELKRLKALEEKNKALRQQKEAIKNALSSIDQVKPSKKIVFDDDGDPVSSTPSSSLQSKANFISHGKNVDVNNVPKGPRNDGHKRCNGQLQLFNGQDDETDTWEGDFRFKKQFEGKKGKKLLEMQARFKDDKRFVFDERFYESDEEPDHTGKGPEPPATAEEKDLQEEKGKELEILASVLGEPVQSSVPKKSTFNPMVRFDPLKPSHAKFELSSQKGTTLDKRGKTDGTDKRDRVEEEPIPTDEKQFYQVSTNLRDLFKKEDKKPQSSQSATFSLRQMFASSVDDDDTEGKQEEEESMKKSVRNDQQKPKDVNKTFLRGFQESKPLAMFSKKLLRPEPDSGINAFCKDVNVDAIKEKFSEKRRVLGRMLHKKKILLERQQHFKLKIGVAAAAYTKSVRRGVPRQKQYTIRGRSGGRM